MCTVDPVKSTALTLHLTPCTLYPPPLTLTPYTAWTRPSSSGGGRERERKRERERAKERGRNTPGSTRRPTCLRQQGVLALHPTPDTLTPYTPRMDKVLLSWRWEGCPAETPGRGPGGGSGPRGRVGRHKCAAFETLQGYLAHKKPPPHRTLQSDHA